MASSTSPQSSAVSASGPSLSSVQQSAIAPWRLTRPYVGRNPVAPLNVAGQIMLPLVSLPRLKPTQPSAVALPEPVLDPPAHKLLSKAEWPGPLMLAFATL